MQASVDRLGPVRRAREEMSRLRTRLEELEATLEGLETQGAAPGVAAPPRSRRKT